MDPTTRQEWNNDGFALVHRAVIQKNNLRIEKLLSISPISLEAKTTDKHKLTPLLVAAKYGCVETFHFLLKMGANVHAKSAKGLNTVQCALVHKQSRLVCSLLDHPQFPVIQEVFGLVRAESLQVGELANCLEVLNRIIMLFPHHKAAMGEEERRQTYEEQIKAMDGVTAVTDLIQMCLDRKDMLEQIAPILAKILENLCFSGLDLLESSVPEYQVKLMEVMTSSAAIVSLIHVGILMIEQGACSRMMSLHAPRACMNAAKRTEDEEVMREAMTCLFKSVMRPEVAENLHKDGILEELVSMLRSYEYSDEIKTLIIHMLIKIATINEAFRKVMLEVRAVHVLLADMTRMSRLVTITIDFLRVMCVHKGDTEEIVKESKPAISTLIHIIKHSISQRHKHKAFEILWIMAGTNIYERRSLASLVGPAGLTSMLNVTTDEHLLPATTALKLLSPAIFGKQEEIVEKGAVMLLLSAIKTAKPSTKLEALCTLENCSHDIAFRPIEVLQEAFLHERGIQVLLKLQAHTHNLEMQLQAVCTLAAVSIGNSAMKKSILTDPLFSLGKLIHLLTRLALASPEPSESQRRNLLLAARSICYFAYNSLDTQRTILAISPLPIKPYDELMSSTDTATSTEAAFSKIVLARVFDRNKSRVEIVASCIRFLVSTLMKVQENEDDEMQVQVCSLVSALLHMRAGICQAFIAADIIPLLVNAIFLPIEYCRRTAAIALSYIIKENNGCRIVLRHCRKRKDLFSLLENNTEGYSLEQNFVQRWRHYHSLAPTTKRDKRVSFVSLPLTTTKKALLFSEEL